MTIIDVETSLFPRVNLEHVGLGGIGIHLFLRPERPVAASMTSARPSTNRRVSRCSTARANGSGVRCKTRKRSRSRPSSHQAPKGFGLLQRDRSLRDVPGRRAAFRSAPEPLDRAPRAIGDQGSVQLLEIPNDAEINDNILAYWRPKAPMTAGSEVAFAYRQYWCWVPPERPPLATVLATRVGRGSSRAPPPLFRRIHRRHVGRDVRQRT